MKKRADRYPLFQRLSPGGADVSGVTATAPDVDEGKIFVDNTGEQVVGTSTYKADYIALSDNIDDLNEDLEEVITGDGTGGGLTLDSVKGLIDRSVTDFTIPDGTQTIGLYAFYNCTNLQNLPIPPTVTSIRQNAFYGCSELTLSALPNGITNIEWGAFDSCRNITLTELPSGITSINMYTFNNCKEITITEIPAGVKSIGERAFYGCIGLTSITFLGTPTQTINSSAFGNCTNLTTIRVPWQEGEVANAPWGAVNSSIIYGYTPS